MANDITTTTPPSFLTIINNAIENPAMTAEVLHSLIDANERILSKQAEMDFNQAMTSLQKVLPVIHQKSEIKHGDKLIAKYAKYDDIDRIIRPLYSAEGFSLSFNSQRMADGTVVYYGTVAHESGHSRTAEMILPADTGPGRNAVQAQGSTLSYAKRYLVMMLLNLVTTGEDDDGESAGSKTVTDQMVLDMEELIATSGADRGKFLEHFKVTEISDLSSKDYTKAMALLKAKGKAK